MLPAAGARLLRADARARARQVRASVRKLCDACRVVRRKGTVFVVCDKVPKHKQRQGLHAAAAAADALLPPGGAPDSLLPPVAQSCCGERCARAAAACARVALTRVMRWLCAGRSRGAARAGTRRRRRAA